MATPNGILPAAQNARKRMIQPVLPALPIQRKPRKNIEDLKEPAQAVIVGVVNEQPPSPATLANGSDHSEHGSSQTTSTKGPTDQGEEQEERLAEEVVTTSTKVNGSHDSSSLVSNMDSLSDSLHSHPTEAVAEEEPWSTPEATSSIDVLQLVNGDVNTISTPEQPYRMHELLHDDAANGHVSETEEKSGVNSGTNTFVNGLVSPLANNSQEKDLVELSEQVTPTLPATQIVSPENMHASNPPVTAGSEFQHLPQIVSNGHVSPIHPPGLHRPQISVSSSSVSSHFPSLFEHISQLAYTKEWADWSLEINQPTANNPIYVCYAHGFALLRSDRMKKIIARTPPSYPASVISLYPSKFILPHAFEAAVKFLYTDTILTAESLFPANTFLDFDARAQRVDYVLSYWVSGLHLGIEPIITCSYNIIASTIDWDIAELLLKEAAEIRNFYRPIRELETPPDYFGMADSILRLVFGLFTRHLDLTQFKLDRDAQPMTMTARFAKLESSKAPTNPALAGMVFGTMPSTGNLSPTSPASRSLSLPASTIASAVLLNLDFADLENLSIELVRFHGSEGVRVISEAVEEREKRRLYLVNNRSIPNSQRMANSVVWDNVGVREMVVEGKLRRERVGYLLSRKR